MQVVPPQLNKVGIFSRGLLFIHLMSYDQLRNDHKCWKPVTLTKQVDVFLL